MPRFQCVVQSATIVGVEAVPVSVEVVLSSGIPGFSIVGMPDAAIQESRERVKAAVKACGFSMPTDKVVVNLAPGDVRKTGSGFDLPIALALLGASGQIDASIVEHALVVGELSLEGFVRPVKGTLAYEMCARDLGSSMVCATSSEDIVSLAGLEVKTAQTLADFRHADFDKGQTMHFAAEEEELDFDQVGGHEVAKRALQIAAAGDHGVMMIGPPGSGKTMLASRIPTILPPLENREMLETAQIYSVIGEDLSSILAGRRPFRNPHHSTSLAGLVGGGSPVRPGEVSLAHNGVLFLDELAEFKPSTLQGIRQPMEEGSISIVRAEGTFAFPARFMLVAATNPCPCGYYGDPDIACSCTLTQVNAYQNRIGGPLLDRIDLQLDVWRSDFENVVHASGGTSSKELRTGVMAAREYAFWRKGKMAGDVDESTSADITQRFDVDATAEAFLKGAAEAFNMSGRGIVRTLSVARTIADMVQSPRVLEDHVAEALSYRMREGSER